MKILVALLLTVVWALPVLAQPDETAQHFHVFPHIADGGGWQSSLIVTNAGQSSNSCTLELNGLTADRFEAADGIMVEGSMAKFDLQEAGGHLVWSTRNEMAVGSGYATLDCVDPVTAQVVFALTSGTGEPTGIATVFSAQPGFVFQFPILKQDAVLAFAIANNTDTDADCGLALVDLQGENLGHTHLTVPSKSNHAQVLNTSIPIPDDFPGGSATIDCDQQVAAIGIHSETQPDGVNITFSTLPPTILPTSQFQNTDGLWEGTWKDAMIVTQITSTNPALAPCQGLVNCGGTNFALTVELVQSGSMVTGTVKSTVYGADVELMVAGEVSDDGTLSLSSEDPASFVLNGIPLMATLSSWGSRQDTLGTMTGSMQFNINLSPTVTIATARGCLGDKTLDEAASMDVSMLSSACSGLRRSDSY
ncbi:MAG: hypothetical protein OXH92_06855 [Bryobacterales bacterium]|nr:hypothetical protein [Bryobacterales bacterium]